MPRHFSWMPLAGRRLGAAALVMLAALSQQVGCDSDDDAGCTVRCDACVDADSTPVPCAQSRHGTCNVLKKAPCERQSDGTCGFTATAEVTSCVDEATARRGTACDGNNPCPATLACTDGSEPGTKVCAF